MPLNFSGHTPPQAFAAALQSAEAGGIESTTRIELDRATEKHLRPLGHEIVLWGKALGVLQSRRLKNKLPAELAAFLDHWLPSKSAPSGPSDFAVLLGGNEQCLQVYGTTMAFGKDPLLWALARLPALRDTWAADLRASHLDHLLQVLPHAWVVDPEPLVPGSEIAGLGLGSWTDLDRLHHSGRSFELRRLEREAVPIAMTGAVPVADWRKAIEAALESQDHLLVERPQFTQWWLARYGVKDDKVILLEAYQAAKGEFRKAALG